MNNGGGYHGSAITTPDEYETHIVSKHSGKPAYPGPADVELYDLHLPHPPSTELDDR